MVGRDAGFAVHRAAFKQFIGCVALESGHEKNGLFPKSSEPGVVYETLVKDHDGASGQLQGLSYAAFVGFGVGDGRKSRDMPVVVQQGVHFDAAFGLAKRGPGKERKAEFDGRGVQAEQLGFEPEFVLRSLCRAQAVHFGE